MSSIDTRPAIVKEIAMKASAERIFRAFTVPEERLRWWGAAGKYRGTHNESDLRVGGRWESRGVSADGTSYRVFGTYLEVDPPRLLAFTWRHDWDADAPETIVRIELEERAGDQTIVRLTHSGFTAQPARDDHDRGWDSVLGWWQAYAEHGVGVDERGAA
jgi:uncharacterized protein YndB with AHSA1/START domain